MDNVINFLLEYYIWILVILAVAIITIIGFLVDSKQKRKNKDKVENNLTEVKTVEPLPAPKKEQNADNVSLDETQSIATENNNIKQEREIEEIKINDETSKQELSLSEQKPHFEPKEINIPITSIKESESSIIPPKPINAVNINKPLQQPVYQNVTPVTPQQTQLLQQPVYQNIAPVAPQQMQPLQQPVYQNVTPVTPQQTQPLQQPVYQNVAAVTPQQTQPLQQPVYQNVAAVTPQQTQPLQQPVYQNVTPVTPQITQPLQQPETKIQNIPSQPSEEQSKISTTPGIGINFVTGSNSTDDDSWTL